jgi:hypothetical protein
MIELRECNSRSHNHVLESSKNERGDEMKAIKFHTNHVIFLVFLSLAALITAQTGDWIEAVFWSGLAVLFLFSDFSPRRWWR